MGAFSSWTGQDMAQQQYDRNAQRSGEEAALFGKLMGAGGGGGNYGLQSFANQGSGAGHWANAAGQLGNTMANEFQGNQAYANQALQQGFDPMRAQYSQGLADLTDSTNAGLAARGLGTSPYAAGVEANAVGRFRNDWQTAQIGREHTAMGTATGLQGQQLAAQQAGSDAYGKAGELLNQQYGIQGDILSKASADMHAYLAAISGAYSSASA